MLSGNVLLTGGSGFLGRAILRRAEREHWPAHITVFSRDEYKQYQLKRRYPSVNCVLGDVRDIDRLAAVMVGHKTVIHMGAVKFIPEAEHNVIETIDVNVNGSINVARAAARAGVERVVGISTDKACAPLNTYGMTKALMERSFAEANRWGGTHFTTVRYGNVVGSTGSVIPVFRDQINDFNEVRVTDGCMTRFWLSVDEAIDLIIWSLDESSNYPGATFIPYCPAMKIDDIAQAVWRMQRPDEKPRITYTGLRPGEKLHESLFNEQEAPRIRQAGVHGLVLAPATQRGFQTSTPNYTSDMPRRWLSQDEMCTLIEDATTV